MEPRAVELMASRVNDKITHSFNEAILDAVEDLEDKPYTREQIMELGTIEIYSSGERIFYWKGRRVLLMHNFRTNQITMELEWDIEQLY